MAQNNTQTVSSAAEKTKLLIALIIAIVGLVGFSFFSTKAMYVRVGVLVVGVLIALAIAFTTEAGKSLVAFARDSWTEVNRVTWPSRQETVRVTLVVFGFVVVMSLFMFGVDKGVEWVLYDLILRWK